MHPNTITIKKRKRKELKLEFCFRSISSSDSGFPCGADLNPAPIIWEKKYHN